MAFLGAPWLTQLVFVSPILIAMAYDLMKQRKVHPIYLIGVIVLIAELRWRGGFRGTETWADISAWLATFFV